MKVKDEVLKKLLKLYDITKKIQRYLTGERELLLCQIDHLKLYEQKLQDISLSIFGTLTQNDILFIDSSHVCKIFSDVNYLFAKILPNLQPGVVIHIHDIHFPFEYPEAWVRERRAWNEAYILRSFLQFNSEFEILFWPSFMIQFHKNHWQKLVSREFDGTGSIWLIRK